MSKVIVGKFTPLRPMLPSLGAVDASASEIKNYNRCMVRWAIKYVLDRRLGKKSRALNVGNLVHDSLAHYYRKERDDADEDPMMVSFKKAYGQFIINGNQDDQKKLMREVAHILRNYQTFYQEDWELLTPEIDFERIPVFDRRFAGFIHGRFDGLATDKDMIWIVDHKTGKKFTPKTFELDPQIDLYSLAGVKLFGTNFGGVIINYIRSYVSKKSLNFVRVKVIRSKSELTFIEENLARILRKMGATTPSDLVFNFTKNCTWDCDYLSVCRRLRAGQSISYYVKHTLELRDRSTEGGPK